MDSADAFQEFVDATCNILAEDGFASYLPTLSVGGEILVAEGIPTSVPHTDALQDLSREYGLDSVGSFFAVLAAPDLVVAGQRLPAGWQFVEIQAHPAGMLVQPSRRPSWFNLGA
ncbi:hypothetical protein [Lysobacter sp. HA35]